MERTQAPAATAAPAPDVKARNNTDRPLKPRNLLADTNMDVVLGMSFLFLSNADVEFAELRKLI